MTRKPALSPASDEELTDRVEAPVADGTAANGIPLAPLPQQAQAFDEPASRGETRRGHSRRMARRSRLYGYTLTAVALFAFVIVLAASNTAHVKVSWLFGSSRVSLVWLVLAAAILGWLLGLVTGAALRRRTRAPRPNPEPHR